MTQPPLAGCTVLDLTHVLAGPYCTMTLSDLGAKVIKVERPGGGDDTREFPPFVDGMSAYFATINHGKESIALDLREQADRAIFDRLLERADILVENYRPGVMDRLGYGWDDLHAKYPALIYGAVSGFGHSGPEMLRPAYDMVVQARGGVMSITGEKDREPVRVGASVGDIVAGMFLAQGLMAALVSRQTTGLGQKVDVAMLDSQIAILEHAVAMVSATGKIPGPSGARHPTITPFETYHAKDGLFVIAAGNDTLFRRFCEAMGAEWHKDERFRTNALRCDNVKVLKRLIETLTLEQPKAHWIELLQAAGIPTGAIQNVAEALNDPQLLARHMVVEVPGPSGHVFTAAGNPIKMSGLDDTTRRGPVPELDGNRQEILDWLDAGKTGD